MTATNSAIWALIVIATTVFAVKPSAQEAGPIEAARKAVAARTLVGLWQAEREFSTGLSGALDLYLESGTWLARLANFDLSCAIDDEEIRFTVPGQRGEFRGKLSGDSTHITGHWIQPEAVSMSVKFASPLTLTRVSGNHWRGQIVPMRDRMTMFFSLTENSDSTITGFLRNPQLNFGRFFKIKNVTLSDNQIKFFEEGREGTRLPGTYYPDYDMFSVIIPDAGGTFDFVRVEDSISDFYPRPTSNEKYAYRPPVKKADGWPVASLEEVGMTRAPIEELVTRIVATPMDAIDSPYIHALLISRRGKLVVEEYFHGYDGNEPHDTRSASKSVTATLVGVAEHKGLPVGLSTPVYSQFYEGAEFEALDIRKKQLTVEHLITMTPGLACYDGDSESPGNEDVMQNQADQPDWARYTLDLPMLREPGKHAAYCSASMNLAGAVISAATDMWLPEFFHTYFAVPLQLGLYHMNLTPVGEGYGGGGLRLTARDFLKLGHIYLNKGEWRDHKILGDGWIDAALKPHAHMWQEDYGYGWWLISYPYEDREVQAFYAGGNGGQYVIGVPELDLLVTFFAGNYNQRIMHQTKREYVPKYILKAIQ